MLRDDPNQLFYLIVADHDRGVFAVEGPMTDDRPWNEAASYARNHQHRIVCGPTGATATSWRPSIAARTSWPGFRRAAS
jgi:hypothetical protein